ncbi:MAG: CHAT domain-containing protein [Bacteroidetes bacterium]|nr:CHAT domain-containing protein [Bacteroidota bacterium]
MLQKPVIFLAFANDQDDHLEMLKKEGRDIYQALQDLHDQQFLEIYREESADIEDIFATFNRFNNRVAIFHYGGHANGTLLRLEGKDANAKGLARLFGEQEQLQLVFLNGCSTGPQVEQLLQEGIKAIIATSVPVNDSIATEFSVKVYQSLAGGSTLQQAFNQGIAFVETKFGDAHNLAIYRSLAWQGGEKNIEEIPWGLYVNPAHEGVLNWKLPDYKKVSLPSGFGDSIKTQYKVNEYIVSVLEAMAAYNKALYREMEDEFGDPRDPREFPELIIKNFPWPIGSQLRILVANSDMMNQPGMPRLLQLLYTYVITSQFLCYILLAQLWDTKIKGKIALDAEFQETFRSILPMDADGFDFMQIIDLVRSLFKAHQVKPFIEEFEVLFSSLEKKDEVYESYVFLEDVRQRYNHEQITPDEVNQLCNEAEFCLTAFLKKIAFLARYRLITIKDIQIFKPKHKEALFRVQMGILNAFDKEFLREKAREQEIYTDSHSVLLVKNLREMDEYLNLSPFIIDKNAFSGKPIPNIYMYQCQRDNQYEYLTVNYNINKESPEVSDKIITDEEVYSVLKEQFQLFTAS